ncbi:MAG: EVE domain-containing protein [Candidatus Nomurabacteria bacterium]|nr:EVE domain-containing protein [Candidatus Nomurabacteria bacterium]
MPESKIKKVKKYWLIKSEADCYSIDDLKKDKKIAWEGVRNFQARNFMKEMQVGDLCLFHHSNGTKENPTGVYGIAKVVSKVHSDQTQYDKKGEYYEKRATEENPVWFCVDMGFVKKFKIPVTLAQIKFDPKLKNMIVAQPGTRLSIMPVSEKDFEYINKLAD